MDVLNLTLSTDLFIVVIFAIVMSAAFFMGKSKTLHGIVGFYIAFIATEGVGVAVRLSSGSNEALSSLGVPMDPMMLSLGKIFLCAFFFLIIVLRGGVLVSHGESAKYMEMVWTGVLGFALSGLILSTLLATVSAGGFLGTIFAQSMSPEAISPTLLHALSGYRELWYVLPAFVIVVMGVLQND